MHLYKSLFSLLLIASLLSAQESFSLSPYPWMKVSYTGEAAVINTICAKLHPDDPFYHSNGDSANFVRVMDYVPDARDGQRYSILFSMGESADPRYIFYRQGEYAEPAFILHSDHLHFPGDGVIIACGSINEMFSLSRKYRLNRGRLQEEKQPFYAVKLSSIAVRDFDIFRSKRLRNIVAHIGVGEEVIVLLTEFDKNYEYYLIRNKTGLCGWIRVEPGTWVDETPIRDLYYHGD